MACSSTRSIYSSTCRDPLKQVALLLSKRNQFSYDALPVASARRATRHAARRAAHCRLLHLRRVSGCLGTSRGSSRGSSRRTSSTTLPHVGDYFASAARPGASARRAARHVARRRLLRLAQARRRLLRLCRASGCVGTSRGSSRSSSSTTSPRAGSSSTTSPTSCVQLRRHVARLVV
jgi:hypothetical protein